MALQSIGGSLWFPEPVNVSSTLAFTTNALIDATGEKVAFVGQVWTPARTSKTINKVHFAFGTVVKAGGSALTVSLQDISTSGSLIVPDETQDQYRAVANADSGFATDTYYSTGLLTSDGTDGGAKRTVGYGEYLAVVVEFDGSGRLGSDSFILKNISAHRGGTHNGTVLLKASGTWGSATSQPPNILLEFSDGTFGTLENGFPLSVLGTHAFNSGTAGADEYGLRFSVPFAAKIDGAWVAANGATSADFDLVLYSGTTALATLAHDNNRSLGNVMRSYRFNLATEVTLSPNTAYTLAVKPTSANNITLPYYEVGSASHLEAHDGGTGLQIVARVDGGAWDTSGSGNYAKRRPFMGIRISALSDNVDSGGGGSTIYTRSHSVIGL